MDDARKLLQDLVGVSSLLQKIPWDALFKICDHSYVSGITACMETLDSLEVDKAELK